MVTLQDTENKIVIMVGYNCRPIIFPTRSKQPKITVIKYMLAVYV